MESENSSITHYVNDHEYVPLWVLMNINFIYLRYAMISSFDMLSIPRTFSDIPFFS